MIVVQIQHKDLMMMKVPQTWLPIKVVMSMLSYSHDLNANIMGTPINHYGFSDIMVASFSPDGSLRWVKIIGRGSGDLPFALQTDKIGGVYIVENMNLSNGGGHIDNDATIPANLSGSNHSQI